MTCGLRIIGVMFYIKVLTVVTHYIIEIQIEASRSKIKELEEQIHLQPMSATDVHDLYQSIHDVKGMLQNKRAQQEDSLQRISELQMQHNK